MNKNQVAIIEISSSRIKLVVGYCLNNEVYVLYALEKPIRGIVSRGNIIDKIGLEKELKTLTFIQDSEAKIKLTISDAIVGLPCFGLEVLETNPVLSINNEEGKIGDIDIRHIRNLIAKEKIPKDNILIDVIPEKYTLDQGRIFTNVPLGEVSNTMTVLAKVHTLPKSLVNSYSSCFYDAGILIKRTMVSLYGTVALLKDYPEVPGDYFLLDMGAEVTTVGLVGKNQLYSTTSFHFGGNDITNHIAEAFNINISDAEKYKILYGLDRREMNFKAPVCISEDSENKPVKHYISEMNEIIKKDLDYLANEIRKAVDLLLEDYGTNYRSLPMFAIGGASKLFGLKEYLEPKIMSETFNPIVPKIIGCRNPSFFNILGLIKANQLNAGGFSNPHNKITSVSREEDR